MKAVICTDLKGEEGLEVTDWPTPSCSDGQVRIGVRAASVNFPDTLMIRGLYQLRSEPPFIPGSECAGVILEVGSGVSGLGVGDRVLALPGVGAFATEVIARPSVQQVHPLPDEMGWDDAAAFNLTYGTAIHGLRQRGNLQAGQSVLVLGAAGGCGSAAVMVAKALGGWVIGAAGGPEKCAVAEQAGADVVVDYRAEESLSARVKELTGGRGVDVLFDPVGGSNVREYLRCLAWNGRYLVVGFAAGEIPTVALNHTILKSISLVGVAYGASAIADPEMNAGNFAQLFDWYRSGLVRPLIGHRFPIEEAANALRVVQERQALGKVVIDVG
jgi:NADPH2:quinone reductase